MICPVLMLADLAVVRDFLVPDFLLVLFVTVFDVGDIVVAVLGWVGGEADAGAVCAASVEGRSSTSSEAAASGRRRRLIKWILPVTTANEWVVTA